MNKSHLARALSLLLGAAMVVSTFPTSALAEVAAEREQEAATTAAAEHALERDLQAATSASGDSASGGGASQPDDDGEQTQLVTSGGAGQADATAENGADAAESDAETGDVSTQALPTRAPLSSVIDVDENGTYQLYVTLFDAKGRVIATDDPECVVDARYLPIAEGGEGLTVDRGAGIRVYMRAASITSNDANGDGTGIQEGVTYVMSLPRELVPVEQGSDGNKLVDPDAPLRFFNSGDVTAEGGVYTSRDDAGDAILDADGNPTYELHVQFANVEDRVDVSGEFQYTTTLSENVAPGSLATVTFVPGGTLSFNVTPEADPADDREYRASLTGASCGTTSWYYQMQVWKSGELADDVENRFDYPELTLSLEDGMGVLVDEDDFQIFNHYGTNSGPGFMLSIAYSTTDESGKSEYETINANSGNIVRRDSDATVVRFTTAKGVQVDVEFRRADAVDGAWSEGSYITNVAHVTISDGNGGLAHDVDSVTLLVPSIVYDDYDKTGNVSYTGTLTVGGAVDEEAYPEISASGVANFSLGNLATPTVSDSVSYANSASGSYAFLPSQVYTQTNTNASSYNGNYYWMDFTPAAEGNAVANYYVSNTSFLPGYSLIGDAGSGSLASTFSTSRAGTFGAGYAFQGTQGSWEFAGVISTDQVRGDPRFVSNGTCFSGYSSDDVKLQYQLKQVFANAPSAELVVYRSASPVCDGRYAYIVVDPGTTETASRSNNNKWREYMECNGSAKPASWRLHFFNMPGTSFIASQFQQLGSFAVSDEQKTGNITTDVCSTGNGLYDSAAIASASTQYTFGTQPASNLNARWVSDDEIFWELTVDATSLPAFNEGYLYVNGGTYLQPSLGGSDSYRVDGSTLTNGGVYVKRAASANIYGDAATWEPLTIASAGSGSSFRGASVGELTEDTTLTSSWGDATAMFRFGSYADLTSYRYKSPYGSANFITLGFFTHVKATGGSNEDGTYRVSAEFVSKTGDISRLGSSDYYDVSGSGMGGLPTVAAGNHAQYPVKISATGTTELPRLNKYGSLASQDGNETRASWTIVPTFTSSYYSDGSGPLMAGVPAGGYTGELCLTDGMGDSTVTDAAGNAVEGVDLASSTHVERMLTSNLSINMARGGSGCGPVPYADDESESGWGGDSRWLKYVDGQWQQMGASNLWDADKPGAYHIVMTAAAPNSNAYPLEAYVFYSGDMGASVRSVLGEQLAAMGKDPSDERYDSPLVVVISGLFNLYRPNAVSAISYTTVTDDEQVAADANAALGASGAEALSSACGLTFENAAGVSAWRMTGKEPVSATVTKSISAGLSIKKSTPGVSQSLGSAGTSASYTVESTVGFTPSEYVSIEDHISGFSDSGNTSNGSEAADYTAADDPDAVSALADAFELQNLTITKVAPDGKTETVYANGAFATGWTGSELKVRADLAGEEGARAGGLFSATLRRSDGEAIPAETTFRVTYGLTLDMDGDGGFRGSEYYHGGSLAVRNGAAAERPYGEAGGGGNRGESDETPVGDEDVVATYELGDETVAVLAGGTSLSGGEIDADKMVLRVWPSADVEADYLTDQVALKTPVKSMNSDGHSSWLLYDWTGSEGKAKPTVSLTDALSFKLNDLYAERDDLTEQQRQAMSAQLMGIAARHVSVSNVKVYLTGTQPCVTSSYRGTTNLSDADLLWSIDGKLDQDAKVTAGGHDLSLVYNEGGYNVDAETGEVTLVAPGFTLSGTSMDFNSYLAATYDMDFDYDAFLAEAMAADLLDGVGNAAGTSTAPKLELTNDVYNDRGSKASSSAGSVEVRSTTFSKGLVSSSKADGSADWVLSSTLGDAAASAPLTFTDHASVTADDDAIREAAEAATSIGSVGVICNGQWVYRDGAVTSQGASAGWTDENVAIETSGLDLTVVLRNVEGASPIAVGQRIQIRYSTTLDKDAFVRELTARGGSLTDAEYALENTGMLTCGSTSLSDTKSTTLEPTAPVTADKVSVGNPDDGAQTDSFEFTATAGTGFAARKGFSLTDTPEFGTSDNAQAAAAALKVSSLSVTVTAADGSSQTYDAADVLSGALPGATLTTANGDAFALDQAGAASWKLAFDELAAGTTVEVDYVLTVDRDAYIAAGGELNGYINFHNALSVSCSDGSTASDGSYGWVRVRPDVTKRGDVLDEKAPSGNPLLRWTFDVDLATIFDSGQLAKLSSVEIKDPLDQRLRAVLDSVEVYDLVVNVDAGEPWAGSKLDASEYDVCVDEDTNTLVVTLKNPSQHPRVRIVANTECIGSTSGLSNSVDLVIDGTRVDGTKTDVKQDLIAVTEYGSVTSAVAPSWTPTATKTVDGAQPGEALAGRFTFRAVEVDEAGEPIEGGYESTATNDAAGNVTFDTITYKRVPIVGDHYYRVSELAADDDSFRYDATSYLVHVSVSRAESGGYVAEQEILEPAEADAVTFNNETVPKTPETPTTPETPGAPTTPETPAAAETTEDGKAVPQTGDVLPAAWPLLVGAAVVLIGTALVLRRRS